MTQNLPADAMLPVCKAIGLRCDDIGPSCPLLVYGATPLLHIAPPLSVLPLHCFMPPKTRKIFLLPELPESKSTLPGRHIVFFKHNKWVFSLSDQPLRHNWQQLRTCLFLINSVWYQLTAPRVSGSVLERSHSPERNLTLLTLKDSIFWNSTSCSSAWMPWRQLLLL